MRRRVAVVGSGIAGLTAAYRLQRQFDVIVMEANHRAGGHTDTHSVQVGGRAYAVDTGFIVFNRQNYPEFTALLRELGVSWQATDMSFSVCNETSGLVYGADGLRRLFAQPENLLKPSFLRMLTDLRRFYREAPRYLATLPEQLTLGELLQRERYGRVFCEDHILPMAAALWSAPACQISQFPAHYFLSFMDNHRMLQFRDRPAWLTVKGGSSCYVERLLARLDTPVLTDCPVYQVERHTDSVILRTAAGAFRADEVVFACHSDQALALLADPDPDEKRILGGITWQRNQVTLHTDTRHLPPRRAAWAAWNARTGGTGDLECRVSYWMNLLQKIDCPENLIVTLNAETGIDPDRVLAEREYMHPVYSAEVPALQRQRAMISGRRRTWYCGAYWGWGFHEDGTRSALEVVRAIMLQYCRPELAAPRSA